MSDGKLPDGVKATALLQGRYEAEDLPKNLRERSVSDFGHNVLNRKNCLYEPVLDKEHIRRDGSKPNWPDDKEFAVCLTHDVDHVTACSLKQAYRRINQKARSHLRARKVNNESFVRGDFVGLLRSLAIEGRKLTETAAHSGEDPYHCLERWLDIEDSVSAKSTFFFLPTPSPPYHVSDPEYRFSDEIVFDGRERTVGSVIREIDSKGWEIGLHPTWYAFDDAKRLRREKSELENVVGGEVESVRHHFLHYDIRQTPRVQNEAGFKYDSTLGFNRNVGFRFGRSYPWKLYDIEAEEPTNVLEVPLVIQDGALFRSRGLNVDEELAFEYVKELVKQVRSTNGVLTLLWHPSKITRESWWSLYERILEYLNEQNAWFATVRELGSWWRENGPIHEAVP